MARVPPVWILTLALCVGLDACSVGTRISEEIGLTFLLEGANGLGLSLDQRTHDDLVESSACHICRARFLMSRVPERRKARVESTFEIEHPGDQPHPVSVGPCWIEEGYGQVALHVGRDAYTKVLILSAAQFQVLLHQRRLVFVSW